MAKAEAATPNTRGMAKINTTGEPANDDPWKIPVSRAEFSASSTLIVLSEAEENTSPAELGVEVGEKVEAGSDKDDVEEDLSTAPSPVAGLMAPFTTRD